MPQIISNPRAPWADGPSSAAKLLSISGKLLRGLEGKLGDGVRDPSGRTIGSSTFKKADRVKNLEEIWESLRQTACNQVQNQAARSILSRSGPT